MSTSGENNKLIGAGAPGLAKEFLSFLKEYGIIGLAIAVIIGGKLNNLITSIVNDIVLPVLLQPVLNAAKIDDIRNLNYHGILYGKALGAGIDFLIVAFLVFMFAKKVLREEVVKKK